jgi:hypothetical protein
VIPHTTQSVALANCASYLKLRIESITPSTEYCTCVSLSSAKDPPKRKKEKKKKRKKGKTGGEKKKEKTSEMQAQRIGM